MSNLYRTTQISKKGFSFIIALLVMFVFYADVAFAADVEIVVENGDSYEHDDGTMLQPITFTAKIAPNKNLSAFGVDTVFNPDVASFDSFDHSDFEFFADCNPVDNKMICSGADTTGFTTETDTMDITLFAITFGCPGTEGNIFTTNDVTVTTMADSSGTALTTELSFVNDAGVTPAMQCPATMVTISNSEIVTGTNPAILLFVVSVLTITGLTLWRFFPLVLNRRKGH